MRADKHFWILFAILIAGGTLINLSVRAGDTQIERTVLKELPDRIGTWQKRGSDARFDAATEAVLKADDYVSRDYISPESGAVSLYIGYYKTQRTGATYHSPLNCMPGSGWELTEPARITITPADGSPAFDANKYVVKNGDVSQLLIYWYQGRGRAVASEYVDKVYTVVDSVRRRRSDGAMVRVLVPVVTSERDASDVAQAFSAQLSPHLSPYVPN